jgi:hypothetical protein
MLKRLLLSVCVAALFVPPAHAQTVDQIIAKYLAARGGAKKIRAVQSLRLTGHLSFGPGAEGPFTVEFKRPTKMHMEIHLGSQLITRICDGQSGWFRASAGESGDARPMSAEETRNATLEMEEAFGGPLPDYKAKGIKVELAGQERAGESDTWKLQVTYPDGTLDSYFIDMKTHLPVKWEGQRKANGQPVVYESWFRSYLTVEGLKFANFIESGVKGDPKGPGQKLTIEKIELNVPLDDALFSKPAPANN